MREAVIVEAVRTPIGKKNGILKNIRPDELAAFILNELTERAGLNSSLVDDVIMGCVSQTGEQSGDIARIAAFDCRIPS